MILDTPLSRAEEGELDRILRRVRGNIASYPALDGFLAAVVRAPDMIMPGEFLPILQQGKTEADDLKFQDTAEANRFLELVLRQCNVVQRQIADFGKMERGERVFYWPPIDVTEGQEIIHAGEWAEGFLIGTRLRPKDWDRFFDLDLDDAEDSYLFPIFVLASERDPDPEMRPFDKPLSNDAKREFLKYAVVGIKKIYDAFENDRRRYDKQRATAAGIGPKVGRNEPCPCGSGKKYKKCCLPLRA